MNGDVKNRNSGFASVTNTPPPWTNPQIPVRPPNFSVPPPNFSLPPPNMCSNGNGNFPRFSGPMYNQRSFQMNRIPPFRGRGGNGNTQHERGFGHQQRPHFNQSNGSPHPWSNGLKNSHQGSNDSEKRQMGYVNDDIFSDAPPEVPCGFPYFNPNQPPPMPNPTNCQTNSQCRGGGRMGFRGNFNRGRGSFHGGRKDDMNRNPGQLQNQWKNNGNNNDNGGFQKKKKPRVDKRELPENNVFFCDICDRGFKNDEKYKEHIDGHEKCSYKDCPFVAAPKLVQLHISMQHRGGMAKKIWSVESEEDIKKWKEERRRNYPTADNMKKKKEIMETRIARGEVIETKDFSKMSGGRQRGRGRGRGRGRDRGRFHRGRRNGSYHHEVDERRNGDDDDDGPPEEIKIQRSRAEDESVAEQSQPTKATDTNHQKDKPDVERSPNVKKDKESGLALLSGYGMSSSDSDSDNDTDNENNDGHSNGKADPAANHKTEPNNEKTEEEVEALSSSHTKLSSPTSSSSHKTSLIPSTDKVISICDVTKEDNVVIDSGNSIEEITSDNTTLTNNTANKPKESPDSISNMEEQIKLQSTSLVDDREGSRILVQDDIERSNVSSKEDHETRMSGDKEEMNVNKGAKRGQRTKEGPPDKRPKFTPRPPKKSYTLLEKLLAKEIRRERNKILQCIHFMAKNKFFDSSLDSSA